MSEIPTTIGDVTASWLAEVTGLPMGSSACDLAYFITQSLAPDTATTHERSLFDRYDRAVDALDLAALA